MSKKLTESILPNFGKKTAVVYCRVSTDDQAREGLSIESQENICRESAVKDGYSVLEVIKDEGKSGGSLKRQGVQRVMKLVVGGDVKALYVVHSDRLARNTADHLTLRELFRKNGVELKCVHQPIMDDSAVSRTMDTIMATFNEMQRLITSEKVKMTMTEKAKAGYYPCMAPIGYKNITNPDLSVGRMGQKIIVIDPQKASLVKKGFELYATGNYNAYEVSDILYEKGLKTKFGRQISHSMMFEMLRNRFYTGEVHWGSVDLKNGKHEPLIDEELFNRVQKVLVTKNKHVCRRRKFSWLLSGFIRCYKHESRYTAEWHLNKSKAYYHCTNRLGCGKYIETWRLEDMVADKFKTLEFNRSFIDRVISKAQVIFYERRKTYENKRKECVNQRTAFEIKRKMAEDKLFAGVISDDDFTRVKREIDQEIQNVDSRLVELEKQRNVNVDVAQEILNLTRNIFDAYQKASPKLKRQYLGFFWERFEVADGLIIKSVPSLLFDQLLKLEQVYQKDENLLKPMVSNSFIKSAVMSAPLDSNQEPPRYKLGALTIELGAGVSRIKQKLCTDKKKGRGAKRARPYGR